MTPVSSQRHEALREIGFELRNRAEVSIVRRRRRQMVATCGTALAAVVLSVGIALPRSGGQDNVAIADVLHKAASQARQDLHVGPDQFLYRGAKLYRHYWRDRGELYDYWTVADEQHWIADDGSALLRISKAIGPTFETPAEQQRFESDGSPIGAIKISKADEQRTKPGSLDRVFEDSSKTLGDYVVDLDLVRKVLRSYTMSAGSLVALADDQDEFNEFVLGNVRDLIAELEGKDPSQIGEQQINRTTTSLIIGLFVSWGDAMPEELRPAFLDLLADVGGSGFEFDPSFRDEQGHRWIAFGTEADGKNDTSQGQAHDTLLFDPKTFEQRGIRSYGSDGRIDFTEVLQYAVADKEGEVPNGLPSL